MLVGRPPMKRWYKLEMVLTVAGATRSGPVGLTARLSGTGIGACVQPPVAHESGFFSERAEDELVSRGPEHDGHFGLGTQVHGYASRGVAGGFKTRYLAADAVASQRDCQSKAV